MTDGRERPERPGEPSVEVPLSGDGPLAIPAEDDGSPSPPNWRKVVGRASLAGVAVGIAVAVVLMALVWNDDASPEDGLPGGPTTTVDGFDPAVLITTPPTLAGSGQVAVPDDTAISVARTDPSVLITTPPTLSPLETIPGVDEAPTGPAGPGAPPRDASLVEQVEVPIAAPTARDITASPDSFDLVAAVDELDGDLARRSTTRLELGVAGYIREYTIVRDPATDRYALDIGGLMSIADESAGLSYVDVSSFDEQQWVSLDSGTIAESFGVERTGTLYERMLRGPLRPDTLSSATVTAGGFVTLPVTDTLARAFEIELPGSAIPEWQLYAFGPTDEFVPSDRPDRLTYTVYVDEGNQIRRLVGLSDLGGIPQLVVHDIETLAEPVAIELPDPAIVESAPPG